MIAIQSRGTSCVDYAPIVGLFHHAKSTLTQFIWTSQMNGNNPLPIVISEPQKTAIAQYTGIVDDNVKAIVGGHNFIDN